MCVCVFLVSSRIPFDCTQLTESAPTICTLFYTKRNRTDRDRANIWKRKSKKKTLRSPSGPHSSNMKINAGHDLIIIIK